MGNERDIANFIHKCLQKRFGNYFENVRIKVINLPGNKLRIPPDKLKIPGDKFGLEHHTVF